MLEWVALLAFAAQADLAAIHSGIEQDLRRRPVLERPLPEHPELLAVDRCATPGANRTVVWLSYETLDCTRFPGVDVYAPRLIADVERERWRRMGYPFGQVPLGFELAVYERLKREGKRPELSPTLEQLFGEEPDPRPEEMSFGRAIRHHRSTGPRSSLLAEDGLRERMERHFEQLRVSSEIRRESRFRTQGPAAIARLWHEQVVGELPASATPLRPVWRDHSRGGAWRARHLTIDALPGVPASGVLLDRGDGIRRPLVVLQHGLEGTPESWFSQAPDSPEERVYRNLAERLVAEGFSVFCPQNPYRGDFRRLQLLAHPRGLSLFSYIAVQHRRLLDHLVTLPEVDPARVAFYGISYGGKTALNVAVFEPRYQAVICSGNFNEWIDKLINPTAAYSYVPTREYEMFEWRQAEVASHAELAAMALLLHRRPVPFLIERGHSDKVGIDSQVEKEFRRLTTLLPPHLRSLVQVAFFDGPHRIDGAVSVPYLRVKLGLVKAEEIR